LRKFEKQRIEGAIMKKEIKDINVKELIDEINESTVSGEVIKKVEKKPVVRENEYEFLTISGCDFILNRKTKKTNKTLVCIQSQNILYIYDELKDVKITVTDSKQIKSFFNDKHSGDLIIEPGKINYAKNGIYKDDIDIWYDAINNEAKSIQYLMKRGLCEFKKMTYSGYYNSHNSSLEKCYENNPALLAAIFQKFPDKDGYVYSSIAFLTNKIYEMSDLDTARYFLDKLELTSMDIRYYESFPDLTKYNLNVRRFIDYILFDLYKQGKSTINLTTYGDYLKQEYEYYGKVKDKYPKALETAHKIISQKTVEKSKLKGESPKFAEIMSECEDFSYQNPIDKFKILMPTISLDLVDEGQYLCHCVASYVEKVNNGDCIVVFMREKENDDIPYLTIEILSDRSVSQVEGMNKRSELTEEEILFINRWAKFKHLKVTAQNAVLKKSKKEKEIV